MKKAVVLLFPLFFVAFLLGCATDGSGVFTPDEGVDPYGYEFQSMFGSTNASVPADLRAVVIDPDTGKLFVGGYDGLYVVDPTAGTPVFSKITAGFASSTVNCLYRESNGDLLIGTDQGLYRRTTAGAVSAISGLGVDSLRIMSVTRQSSTIIWVGVEDVSALTRSIAKAENDGAFVFYGAAEGMTASSVVQIAADNDLVVACGVGGEAGLFQFTGTKFKLQDDILLTEGARMFYKTATSWYVGGPGSGLKTTSTSGATRTWKTLIESVTPYALVADTSMSMARYWLATSKGLYLSYDLATWQKFDASHRLPLDNCVALAVRNNVVWIAHPSPAGGLSYGYFKGD
jgi:ligand-binding sensor domain-containing protein